MPIITEATRAQAIAKLGELQVRASNALQQANNSFGSIVADLTTLQTTLAGAEFTAADRVEVNTLVATIATDANTQLAAIQTQLNILAGV